MDKTMTKHTKKIRDYKYPSPGLDAALDGWMDGKCVYENMAVRPGAHVLFARAAVIYSEARTFLGVVILELRS